MENHNEEGEEEEKEEEGQHVGQAHGHHHHDVVGRGSVQSPTTPQSFRW